MSTPPNTACTRTRGGLRLVPQGFGPENLSDMDAEIAALEVKLSKARQVKAGVMSMLLTGRVRLGQE